MNSLQIVASTSAAIMLIVCLLAVPGTTSARRTNRARQRVIKQFIEQDTAAVISFSSEDNANISTCPQRLKSSNGQGLPKGHKKCLKKCRVHNDCIGGHRQCLCDAECGLSCVRPKQKCRPLGEFLHGSYEIEPSHGWFGSTVRYTCDPGFILIGQAERHCQGDKNWSESAPVCELEGRCGTPPVIGHATHSEPQLSGDDDTASWEEIPGKGRLYRLGTELIYTCLTGYYMDGYYKSTCMGEGHWVGPTMRCLPRRCPHPGQVANSERLKVVDFKYPQVINYRCLEGYYMIGKSQRQCLETGRWSGELPVCRQITCHSLGSLENGHIDVTDMRYGARARYHCNVGYRLEGPSFRSCLADGTWSDETPSCPAVDCGSIGPFYNGFKDEVETTYGSIVNLRCMGGTSFVIHETNELELQCLANGTWSPPIPNCWSDCRIPDVVNGTLTDVIFSDMIQHGQRINYDCIDGFVNGTGSPQCYNGTWTVAPKCVPAPCTVRPREINNVRVRFHTMQHGDLAKYWCDPGFELEGPEYATCLYSNWTEEPQPNCKRKFCQHPGTIANGQIMLIGIGGKFNYRPYVIQIKHNDRIEFVCDRDYLRIGPAMATCVHTAWSPPNKPLCIQQKHPGTRLMYRGRRSVEDSKMRYLHSALSLPDGRWRAWQDN